MTDFNQYRLGEHKESLPLETIEQNREAAIALAQQASRSLHIFTYDLDPLIYDTGEFIEAVKNLAIGHRHSKVQIILQDSSKFVAQGHRLVELARRLSSSIHMRKTVPELNNFTEAFLVADATGLLRRTIGERYEGFVNFNTRYDCKNIVDLFNAMWEKSLPDPELRRLYI
jgi:hypothetical protein